MSVPCIPFTITIGQERTYAWGFFADFVFVLAAGESTRKKKGLWFFGTEERYYEIIRLYWPFWTVFTGDNLSFVDGLKLQEQSNLEPFEFEKCQVLLNRSISDSKREEWEQLASDLDIFTHSTAVWSSRQGVYTIPPKVVEGLGLGLRVVQFQYESDINILSASVNHEEAKNETKKFVEHGTFLDIESQRLSNLSNNASTRVRDWCNFINDVVAKETQKLANERRKAQQIYDDAVRKNSQELKLVRERERSRWREVIDPIDRQLREARSEEDRCNSEIDRASNLNLGSVVSQNRRSLQRIQARIRELERDREKLVADIRTESKRDEEIINAANQRNTAALRKEESRIESETIAVTRPANTLINATARFLAEIKKAEDKLGELKFRINSQFIPVQIVKTNSLLKRDIFRLYVPFYLILFQDEKDARRIHPVLPYAMKCENRRRSFSDWLRGQFQSCIFGENENQALGDYILNEYKMNTNESEKINELYDIGVATGILKTDNFSTVIEKGTSTLLEKGIISSKVGRKVRGLSRELMRLRLNTTKNAERDNEG